MSKEPVDDKPKRKLKKHTFLIILYSSPSISPPPKHDCKDRFPLGIVNQYDLHFYKEKQTTCKKIRLHFQDGSALGDEQRLQVVHLQDELEGSE